MSAEDDAQVREAACDPARSVLLQAPAGSGKTSVLTQRLLRLLGEVDEPEEILAITFTRKAAAEMRARVAGALRGHIPVAGAAGERLRELAAIARARSEQRGWNLLENPARLAIQTIDSFSFRLAAQLPLAARVGGALTITTHAGALYLRAARQTLLAADADRALARDIELLLVRLDNQWTHVETLLAAMLEKRAHWLRHVLSQDSATLCERVNASLRALAESHLATAARVLPASLRARAAGLPGSGARDDTPPAARVGALERETQTLAAWQQLAALTLTAKGEWRSPKGINRTLGPAYGEALARERLRDVLEELAGVAGARELLCELAALPACALKDEDAQALAALSRVLQVAAAQLQAQLAQAGRVDHTYVSGAAREALTEAGLPTELALRVGFALRHILVDEFQDTSLPQLELLAALSAGWEEGEGRSLFLVGDPMQSIYQFREAEVGLFLQARAHGIGSMRLTPLTLSRNFRSTPALIQWINRLCGALFPGADDVRESAVRFTQSAPGSMRPDTAAGSAAAPVRLALLPDRASEAAWIASRVAELREVDAFASIAVLLSARSHARFILQALEARDIPAMGVDLTPLKDLPVIQDLVALTRALHHLGDRIAWLSVLRAPWCGLSLATLTALSQAPDGRGSPGQLIWHALQDPARLAGCAPEDAERLTRVREVLQGALDARGRQPLGQWLEQVWVRLGAADAYAREELPHAQAFFSALTESAASGEWRGPEDLEPLLAGLHARPAASGDTPVQIMTIHRAKGLEFDHVLLPALDRAQARDREPLLRWLDLPRLSEGTGAEAGSDLLMAPVPALEAEDAGEVGRYLKRLTQRRQQHEQLRLLYVALTRARHSLHLSASPPVKSDGSVRPRTQTLLGRLWPVLGNAFEVCAAGEDAAAAAPGAARSGLRRLRAAWQPAPLPPAVALSSLPLGPPEQEAREFSWVGETARHIGTVAHAALCALAGSCELPDEAAIRSRCAHYNAQLCRLGVPRGQLEAATGEVLQVMLRTLGDPRGRWIFERGHREAVSELALTGLVAGRLTSVVIDRCFVDAEGIRWVLDFKTSRHEGGGREAFLDREMERYRGQLTRYAALARGLGPEPVRAGLYFPLLQAFRELPLPGRRGHSHHSAAD